MNYPLGGTITVDGKTYSISRIDSVYTKRGFNRPLWARLFASPFIIFLMIMMIGSFSNFIDYLFGNDVPQSFLSSAKWLCAYVVLCYVMALLWTFVFSRTYKLCFTMASTVKVVFADEDKNKVESLRFEVVDGIERGYFPNYLRHNYIDDVAPQLVEAEWGEPVDPD